MDSDIEKLRSWVGASRRLVFFGGAGVSTESGIPDFRSIDGLYSSKWKYPPEEALSHDFFFGHTSEFFEFYREKMLAPDARPNAAHRWLAAAEHAGRLSMVVTQNIDGLHQLAGSRNVAELHGSVHRNRCLKCGREYGLDYILKTKGVPYCECGGLIKPEVVLYGEALDEATVARAVSAIRAADMLIVGGTSLTVYPASGLIGYYRGERLALINKTPTVADAQADLVIRGGIGGVLGAVRL